MRTWAIAVTAVAATLVAIPVTTALAMGYYPRPDCFDRAAFDEVVTALPPPTQNAFDSVDAPTKIGSCDIGESYGAKGGYIFYAVDSPGLDDSGWGTSPTGRTVT